MTKCPICGKEVSNPDHPMHVNSEQHQNALKEDDEKSTFNPLSKLDMLIENFERLCRNKIITGLARVNAFSKVINESIESGYLNDSSIKKLHDLSKKWF